MKWKSLWMESFLLLAVNVLSQCVGHAMSMREERETKLALSVKPDTSDSKVVLDDIDNEFEYGADALGSYQLADGTNAYAIPMWFERESAHDGEVSEISSDQHALIVPPFMGNWNRVHPMPFSDPSVPLQPRPMVPKKDIPVYGYGGVAWKDRMEEWKKKQNDKLQVVKHQGNNDGGNFGDDPDDPDLPMMDEAGQPLSRKCLISSSKISPYRLIIIFRLVILGLFFHYRILHLVNDAYGLWLTSVICEIWFAVSWILD